MLLVLSLHACYPESGGPHRGFKKPQRLFLFRLHLCSHLDAHNSTQLNRAPKPKLSGHETIRSNCHLEEVTGTLGVFGVLASTCDRGENTVEMMEGHYWKTRVAEVDGMFYHGGTNNRPAVPQGSDSLFLVDPLLRIAHGATRQVPGLAPSSGAPWCAPCSSVLRLREKPIPCEPDDLSEPVQRCIGFCFLCHEESLYLLLGAGRSPTFKTLRPLGTDESSCTAQRKSRRSFRGLLGSHSALWVLGSRPRALMISVPVTNLTADLLSSITTQEYMRT